MARLFKLRVQMRKRHKVSRGMLMSGLWKKVERWVATGTEARKIELKRSFDLGSRPNRTKLAQIVTAIANTPGGSGYIVLGVLDRRARTGPTLADAVCGVEHDPEGYARQLHQALAEASNPVPVVRYETVPVPGLDKRVGVIVVEPSTQRPHELIRDSEGISRGFYIRRGADTFSATREELKAMFDGTASTAVIVNFAHPITAEQQRQIQDNATLYISDVIDVPVHFKDDEQFASQVRQVVDSAGLTEEEWQTLPTIVNIPGFAYIAAALVAEVHGRAGHFPTILRLKRSPQDTTKFVFAELINLQEIRNTARMLR